MGLKLHEDWGTTPAAIDACLSVAGRTLLCLQLGGRVAIERVRQALGYLLPHLQQAAMRLAAEVNSQRTIRLSTRQHEVLRWLREGKTTWEISRILGIA